LERVCGGWKEKGKSECQNRALLKKAFLRKTQWGAGGETGMEWTNAGGKRGKKGRGFGKKYGKQTKKKDWGRWTVGGGRCSQ